MVMTLNVHHKSQYGLAYLAVLFLIVAISISLAVVSQNEDLQLKREKEQDWLFVGQQYQRAIASYYEQSPNGLKSLPNSLEDLLLDKRYIKPVRYLRKLYTDPVNFNQAWQTILNADGQITGVVSESQQAILSINAVAEHVETGDGKPTNYASIKFEYKVEAKQETDQQAEDADTLQNSDGNPEETIRENIESE
jgi:hypothetical protein